MTQGQNGHGAPDDDAETRFHRARLNGAALGVALLGMQDLVGLLVREFRDAPDARDRIQEACRTALRRLKGTEALGLDFADEASVLGRGIEEFKAAADAAVTRALGED